MTGSGALLLVFDLFKVTGGVLKALNEVVKVFRLVPGCLALYVKVDFRSQIFNLDRLGDFSGLC